MAFKAKGIAIDSRFLCRVAAAGRKVTVIGGIATHVRPIGTLFGIHCAEQWFRTQWKLALVGRIPIHHCTARTRLGILGTEYQIQPEVVAFLSKRTRGGGFAPARVFSLFIGTGKVSILPATLRFTKETEGQNKGITATRFKLALVFKHPTHRRAVAANSYVFGTSTVQGRGGTRVPKRTGGITIITVVDALNARPARPGAVGTTRVAEGAGGIAADARFPVRLAAAGIKVAPEVGIARHGRSVGTCLGLLGALRFGTALSKGTRRDDIVTEVFVRVAIRTRPGAIRTALGRSNKA